MLKKKKIELIIGSNNPGKLKEIKDLLPRNIAVNTPKNLKIKSPKEIGKTFAENSLIKAKFFSKKTGKLCIADDSGLEIYKLNKAPGIYSSRWAGKNNDFNLAIEKIYKKLSKLDPNWINKKIYARFVCALTIYWPTGKVKKATGKVEGEIAKSKKGSYGFGYDPIFIPLGKKLTFGQMKPAVKYKIDHRIAAFKKIKKFF